VKAASELLLSGGGSKPPRLPGDQRQLEFPSNDN
jgi:hypothetical protein